MLFLFLLEFYNYSITISFPRYHDDRMINYDTSSGVKVRKKLKNQGTWQKKKTKKSKVKVRGKRKETKKNNFGQFYLII